MISDQYKNFKFQHSTIHIPYEEYVERLIDLNLISDNEHKILSKSLKD